MCLWRLHPCFFLWSAAMMKPRCKIWCASCNTSRPVSPSRVNDKRRPRWTWGNSSDHGDTQVVSWWIAWEYLTDKSIDSKKNCLSSFSLHFLPWLQMMFVASCITCGSITFPKCHGQDMNLIRKTWLNWSIQVLALHFSVPGTPSSHEEKAERGRVIVIHGTWTPAAMIYLKMILFKMEWI